MLRTLAGARLLSDTSASGPFPEVLRFICQPGEPEMRVANPPLLLAVSLLVGFAVQAPAQSAPIQGTFSYSPRSFCSWW